MLKPMLLSVPLLRMQIVVRIIAKKHLPEPIQMMQNWADYLDWLKK